MGVMHYHPACHQDLLDGKTLYERVERGRGTPDRRHEFVEIVPGHARHCPANMAGESYLLYWMWKGIDIGGSQGHLPVHRYKSESDFASQRQSSPRLFVEAH